MIPRLHEDHENALRLGAVLQRLPFVAEVSPIETNIVIFTVAAGRDPKRVLELLAKRGVLASSMGGPTLRLVTHLDVGDEDIKRACEALVAAGAEAQ